MAAKKTTPKKGKPNKKPVEPVKNIRNTFRIDTENIQKFDEIKIMLKQKTYNKTLNALIPAFIQLHNKFADLDKKYNETFKQLIELTNTIDSSKKLQNKIDILLNGSKDLIVKNDNSWLLNNDDDDDDQYNDDDDDDDDEYN